MSRYRFERGYNYGGHDYGDMTARYGYVGMMTGILTWQQLIANGDLAQVLIRPL